MPLLQPYREYIRDLLAIAKRYKSMESHQREHRNHRLNARQQCLRSIMQTVVDYTQKVAAGTKRQA